MFGTVRLALVALASTWVASAEAVEVNITAKGHAFNPSWSPDGQWLAFELNKYEGAIELYVVKIANGNPVGAPLKVDVPGATSSFATGGSVAQAPNWHPKGMLIFEGSNSGGTNRLYYWAPSGQKASELLNVGQIKGDLSWPSVSPDGKTVAFVSDATGLGDLYTWNRDTNAVTMALTSPFSEMAPRYSADSTSIAYSRKNQGGEDLFVFTGGQSVPRIGGNGDQSRPIWSGGTLVFFSNERGDDRWDIANSAAVGDKKTIAKDIRLPLRASPSLSPDGKWVAYGVVTPEKADAIFLTTVDGSRTVEINTGLVATGEPAMISTGGRTWLAFTALPSNSADWRSLQIIDVTDKLQ
jgi:Tol biopolymer transport system component